MSGERRRYLRQLLEQGERDIVVPPGWRGPAAEAPARAGDAAGAPDQAAPRADAAAPPMPADAGAPPVPADAGAPPVPADTAPAPARPPFGAPAASERAGPVRPAANWQGGPAMYRAGLVVESSGRDSDLFTADPVAALPDLGALAAMVEACRKCGLGHSRSHSVPGEGDPAADFVCVGEAPGATEDETGRPFVGRAGRLLDDILGAIGLAREAVFICNVLKCRPPGNRDPEPLEAQACSPYLHRQLELIRPKVILALGKPAATTLLNVPRTTSLGDLRGRVHRYRGTPLVVTYHPAALLRNPHWKSATWDDVRIARRILDGEPV